MENKRLMSLPNNSCIFLSFVLALYCTIPIYLWQNLHTRTHHRKVQPNLWIDDQRDGTVYQIPVTVWVNLNSYSQSPMKSLCPKPAAWWSLGFSVLWFLQIFRHIWWIDFLASLRNQLQETDKKLFEIINLKISVSVAVVV